MSMQPAEVVRKLIEQWNRHDAEKAAQLLAENVIYLDVTQTAAFQSRKEVYEFFSLFFSAFPNLSFDILNVVTEGSQVVCEWRMLGTQEKEIDGMNGIGESVDIAGVSVCRIEKGKIANQVDYWDSGTMKRQLGV